MWVERLRLAAQKKPGMCDSFEIPGFCPNIERFWLAAQQKPGMCDSDRIGPSLSKIPGLKIPGLGRSLHQEGTMGRCKIVLDNADGVWVEGSGAAVATDGL